MRTHTYAELEVKGDTYKEIKYKLEAAGYHHAFIDNGVIDMHGIGLVSKKKVDLITADLNSRVKKRIELLAQELGITVEDMLEQAKKLVQDAHRVREAERTESHDLIKDKNND